MESVRSNTQDRELFVTRKLDAPVELVWEAWTKPEHIVNWWGPNGFTNTIHMMDVRPGGEWNLVMHGPDGTDYKNKSIFREIIPFRKIVLEQLADQTLLSWHMLFESAEEFVQVVKTHKADEGLVQNVEKLVVYLAGIGMAIQIPPEISGN